MNDEENFLEMERRQIEQIRELDFEELQVEEVDDDHDDSDDDYHDAVYVLLNHRNACIFFLVGDFWNFF